MNVDNVTRVVSKDGYDNQAAPIENSLKAMLPIEIIYRILSYLNKKDKESMILVSHSWKKISMEATRYEEASKIKKMIKALSENLNNLNENVEDPDVRKVKLLSIQDDINFSDGSNLAEVKILIYTLKGSILRVLVDLTKNELETLENKFANINKPIFFENLFYLAITYKKKLLFCSDNVSRSRALKDFSEELILSENIYDAILIAEMIENDDFKGTAFQKISITFAQKGKFKKAKEFVERIPNDVQRAETLLKSDVIAAEKALKLNDTNKALKIVLRWEGLYGNDDLVHKELSNAFGPNLAKVEILVYTLKGSILRVLINLTKKELETLENEFTNINKSIFFKNLFYLAITYKNILPSCSVNFQISRALKDFSKELRSENIYDAILIAEMIANDHYKETAFRNISITFALKGNFKKAKEFVKRIPDDFERAKTLQKIDMIAAEKALELNDINKALKIVLRWEGLYRNNDRVHKKLSKALAKKGKFKEALDVTERLGIEYHAALKKILNMAIKQNKTTEALEIAHRIVFRFDEKKALMNPEERMKFFNKERSLLYEKALHYINDATPSNNVKERAKNTFNWAKKVVKDELSKIFQKH